LAEQSELQDLERLMHLAHKRLCACKFELFLQPSDDCFEQVAVLRAELLIASNGPVVDFCLSSSKVRFALKKRPP
jgi:hypothetical protein